MQERKTTESFTQSKKLRRMWVFCDEWSEVIPSSLRG
ncbi:unnamed protein product [Rhodiola kirilowii]